MFWSWFKEITDNFESSECFISDLLVSYKTAGLRSFICSSLKSFNLFINPYITWHIGRLRNLVKLLSVFMPLRSTLRTANSKLKMCFYTGFKFGGLIPFVSSKVSLFVSLFLFTRYSNVTRLFYLLVLFIFVFCSTFIVFKPCLVKNPGQLLCNEKKSILRCIEMRTWNNNAKGRTRKYSLWRAHYRDRSSLYIWCTAAAEWMKISHNH